MAVSKIVLAIFVPADTGKHIHKNRPSHGLAFHCGGSKIYHFSDGTDLPVGANEIVYLPKYSSYELETQVPGDCWAVNFDLQTDCVCRAQTFSVPDASGILSRFQIASELWIKKSAFFSLKICGLLYEILYYLADISQALPKNRFNKIAPAISYLEGHYTEGKVSITELANMCNMSDTYFRRFFGEQFSMTPVKYINQKRMKLAQELLESAMYSVSDVQEMCGYSDACRFSREFKKFFGCPPGEYGKKKMK